MPTYCAQEGAENKIAMAKYIFLMFFLYFKSNSLARTASILEPNFVLGVKMTHNAKKSVLYVNQHPADTVAERLRGSIKLDFYTKSLGRETTV